MDVSSPKQHSKIWTDISPLLMERCEGRNNNEHIVAIRSGDDASSSSISHARVFNGLNISQHEGRPISIMRAPSNVSNSRNSSYARRGDSRRRRSPLNSGVWISIELCLMTSQIVASIVVLILSKHERPREPLFAWIVGYASGCVASLPLLCWRYHQIGLVSEQGSALQRQTSSQTNAVSGSVSLSVTRGLESEDQSNTGTSPTSGQDTGVPGPRLKVLVGYFKMALDCFFAVWFVVGNVWIFGGHSSVSEAPNLYRLCIVFLTFCCIGYAMPLILCTTICCCLPCIISILGIREDMTHTRGATSESIDALPTYKFKVKRRRNGSDREMNSSLGEGGVVAAGTEKERFISGEDAVCCICLAKYANNDDLRELPCSHFFHKECVDKWLNINALCPLCKKDVAENMSSSLAEANESQHSIENIVSNGLAGSVL